MKITKKRLLLPISIVATALVTGGVAYAVTSLNFSNQASLWATKNCTSALSASSATASNEQKSIICYNYNKNNEQDVNLSSIQNRQNLLVKDSAGNTYGNLVSFNESGFEFYNIQLGLFATLQETTPNNFRVSDPYYSVASKFYTQPNCSGNEYITYRGADQYEYLMPSASNGYFKLNKSTPLVIGTAIQSGYIPDDNMGSGFYCENQNQGAFNSNVNPIGNYAQIIPVTGVTFPATTTGPINLVK